MPQFEAPGATIYYQVAGHGIPVVFCHEFGGDHRSWQPQVSALSRHYQCITYNSRGFPPSSVPHDPAAYSQDVLIEDLHSLVLHLNLDRVHFVGLSMGASIVLNLALRYPELCRSIVVAACGAGATNRERFEQDAEATVQLLRTKGIAPFVESFCVGPTRIQYRRKDPEGWAIFRQQLLEHSAEGSASIMSQVIVRRPTVFALKSELSQLSVPTLLLVGDEDQPCLEPTLFMKREIPNCGLAVFPRSGHPINLEEPSIFNALVLDFFRSVEAGHCLP